MAPKRRRNPDGTFTTSGGSQTGGTGDVKPQFLTVAITAPSAANDFSIATVAVPRIILGGQGIATIMEILRVDWYIGIQDLGDPTSINGAYLSTRALRGQAEAATVTAIAEDFNDPGTFGAALEHHGTGGHTINLPLSVDLTDANGNGVLIATDKFFATTVNVFGTLPSLGTAKILYRMVNVGITEYVGIVQSQLT